MSAMLREAGLLKELAEANERIRQLEAERDGMVLVPRGLLDKFPELNTSNYGPDDVDELNAWGIELVLAAAQAQEKACGDERACVNCYTGVGECIAKKKENSNG